MSLALSDLVTYTANVVSETQHGGSGNTLNPALLSETYLIGKLQERSFLDNFSEFNRMQ